MSDEQLLERIVGNREVMTGKPVIRGTRLTVEHVLDLLAHDSSIDEILTEYEGLTKEDIRACLLFAARHLDAPDMDDSFPSILYRYISWGNEYHKRLVTHNELHFASPSRFNDPFDCKFDVRWPEDPEMCRTSLETRMKLDFPDDSTDQRIARLAEFCARMLSPDFGEQQRHRIEENADKNSGLLCLSATRASLLMWAHYADSHRGLCVGFSPKGLAAVGDRIYEAKRLGSDLMKVEYSEMYPVFDGADLPARGEMVRTAATRKFKDWSYEQEYRIEVGFDDVPKDHAIRRWCYSDDAILEVILGCRMSLDDENAVKAALRQKNPRPALLRACVEKETYALTFVPVEY